MNPLELFCEYVALKRHFSDWSYDYTRFGPVKVGPEAFERRTDAHRFRQLSRKPYPQWTIISTLAANESAWIGDMLGDEAEERRDASIGRIQAISQTLDRELPRFSGNPLTAPVGRHPELAKAVMGGRCSLETGAILMGFSDHAPRWRRWYEGDPAMESLTRRLARYFPLMPVDRRKAGAAVYNAMMSHYK